MYGQTKVRQHKNQQTDSQRWSPHDPYSQAILYVSRYGVEYELVTCGLSGYRIVVDNETFFERFDDGRAFENKVEELTGFSYSAWESAYWKRQSTLPEDPFEAMYGRNK